MRINFFLTALFIVPYTIISSETAAQKPVVVVIPSYNNEAYYKENLSSILLQDYTNWRGYYYDDASTDNTYECVTQFLNKYDTHKRITVIRNSINKKPLANHWDAVHRCSNDTIIINVDGDDALAHPHVFKQINELYSRHEVDPNLTQVTVTFGQYIESPSGNLGHCKPIHSDIIKANRWRDLPLPLPTSHLRTFYAGLFKQIPLQDLLYKGEFFPVSGDIAFFWPILEMSGMHAAYNAQPNYIYRETLLNEYKTKLPLVFECYNYLRNVPRFQPLSDEHINKILNSKEPPLETADLIIFSYNRPLQLQALLESIEYYITGISSIKVICRADGDYQKAYKEIENNVSQVEFIYQSSTDAHSDFKSKTLHAFEQGTSDYILFAVDDIVVKDFVSINQCIKALNKTHAHGFYLRLGKHLTTCYAYGTIPQPLPQHLLQIDSEICAWQFKYAQFDWAYPNTLDMTVYKKDTIKKALYSINYSSPNTMEARWFNPNYFSANTIGLCFENSKIINIPLNRVQNEYNNIHMNIDPAYLLALFNEGSKIDITKLHQYLNKSVHESIDITFIART